MAGNPVVTCPECEKKFKPKADVAGKRIRCPSCTHSFVVGANGEALETGIQSKEKPEAAPTLAFAKDEPEVEDAAGYGVTIANLAARCPNCANEMESEKAIVCLICGYNTMTREWGKTEKTVAVTGGKQFMYLLPGILAVLFIVFQTIGMIYYCVAMPYHVKGTFMEWTDHESMRMWTVIFTMFDIWPIGAYAYKRLIVQPRAAEEKKD